MSGQNSTNKKSVDMTRDKECHFCCVIYLNLLSKTKKNSLSPFVLQCMIVCVYTLTSSYVYCIVHMLGRKNPFIY